MQGWNGSFSEDDRPREGKAELKSDDKVYRQHAANSFTSSIPQNKLFAQMKLFPSK